MSTISKEAYQKALDLLNIVKAESSVDLIKAEEEKKAAELKKAEEEKAAAIEAKQKEINDLLAKAEALQAELGVSVKEAATTTSSAAPAVTVEVTNVEKAESNVADLIKSELAAITKSFTEQIQALGTITVSKDAQIEALQKSLDETKESLSKSNEVISFLGKKIGFIENQPMDRKSVNAEGAFVERFEKSEPANKNVKVLSIKKAEDRAVIADVLYNAIEKEEGSSAPKKTHDNGLLMKAVRCVEQLKVLSDDVNETNRIVERLRSKHNIQVVG